MAEAVRKLKTTIYLPESVMWLLREDDAIRAVRDTIEIVYKYAGCNPEDIVPTKQSLPARTLRQELELHASMRAHIAYLRMIHDRQKRELLQMAATDDPASEQPCCSIGTKRTSRIFVTPHSLHWRHHGSKVSMGCQNETLSALSQRVVNHSSNSVWGASRPVSKNLSPLFNVNLT